MKKEEIDNIIEELSLKLGKVSLANFNKDSILEYGVICSHDEGFLCECRKKWLFDFLREKLQSAQIPAE